MRHHLDIGDNATMDLAAKAHEIAGEASSSLLDAICRNKLGIANAIHILGNLAVTATHSLAILVARQPTERPTDMDKFDPFFAVTPEVILFTTLLVQKICPDRGDKETFATNFSPVIVLEALQAYEKLTGKQPDDFLNPGMVKAARNMAGISREEAHAMLERPALLN